MCLGFPKALGKLVVKYPSNNAHFKERLTENFMRCLFNDVYAILFSVFFIDAYVVGTRLNCLDLRMYL